MRCIHQRGRASVEWHTESVCSSDTLGSASWTLFGCCCCSCFGRCYWALPAFTILMCTSHSCLHSQWWFVRNGSKMYSVWKLKLIWSNELLFYSIYLLMCITLIYVMFKNYCSPHQFRPIEMDVPLTKCNLLLSKIWPKRWIGVEIKLPCSRNKQSLSEYPFKPISSSLLL